MSITAARLGSAPLTLDWSHFVQPVSTGGKLPPPAPHTKNADPIQLMNAWRTLRERFEKSEVGFYKSPVDPEIHQLAATAELAKSLLKEDRFTDCILLGIGGSSLGPLSLLDALQEKQNGKIKIHFFENPDPADWAWRTKDLNPRSTLVCAITKSGTTFETLALYLIALDWLGKERWATHSIVITDPEKGDLLRFAKDHQIRTLPIHPSMGGRFSIFSPVGLFPAVLSGLDGEAFLKGAQQVRDYCERTPLEKNPLFQIAHELIRTSAHRPIQVMMPYATRLRLLSQWFVQLWGESLGKDGKGLTPLAALGAVDQHSILQLLRDGPDDKVTFFVSVEEMTDLKIPKLPGQLGPTRYPALKILEGNSLHSLLTIEMRAISKVLSRKNRPLIHWQMERLDERSLGALYFSLAVLTSVTGTLWGIDPFDQPGVEEGKVYIKEALSSGEGGGQKTPEQWMAEEQSPVSRLRRQD